MEHLIHKENNFNFIDQGQGEVLLLLHGLFGALSNWDGVINKFIEDFVDWKGFSDMTAMGNSLGGHLALMYTLNRPEKIKRLILTGSSGLFENSMGGSFPKRGDYKYIKERVEYTFYDPDTISKDYIDEVFETTKSIPRAMRIVAIAKSAQRNNMANDIPNIKAPTLLIWGLNDTITPPMVAHEFNRLIPNSKLKFIDKCCHAPMMEHPDKFNDLLEEFLAENHDS